MTERLSGGTVPCTASSTAATLCETDGQTIVPSYDQTADPPKLTDRRQNTAWRTFLIVGVMRRDYNSLNGYCASAISTARRHTKFVGSLTPDEPPQPGGFVRTR